ncbi:MAG: RimK/LysX family protein [Candidatus Woesearchaeota archaeon]
MEFSHKIVIGLTEKVTVQGTNGKRRRVVARIDTGATKSSIDQKLAEEIKAGPVIKNKMFRSAHGRKVRPIVPLKIKLAGTTIKCQFSIVDRIHMKYKLLIGQNGLKKGFLIDPSKK